MASLRICIDGFNLGLPKGSGIATYARRLTEALSAMGHRPQILYGPSGGLGANKLLNEVALYDAHKSPLLPLRRRFWRASLSFRGARARPVEPTGEIIGRPTDMRADAIWASSEIFQRANLGFILNRRFTPIAFAETASVLRPEVIHWTCPLPLRDPKAPNLYTLHDLVPLRLPYATLDNKRAFYALVQGICRTADHIVTVSETSKQDIIRVFGVPEARISNTYQCASPRFTVEAVGSGAEQDVEGAFGLEWGGYFLFYGAIEPKKNLARVIEAYLSARVSAPLVIVGARAWLDDDELGLVSDEMVGSGRIKRYDFLPEGLLARLIMGARAVLFPSLYEGFGLPVLEAMQLGAPVLASTGGALPEVAGDAAILVDPFDVGAIKRAIRALDGDAALRADLSARGLQRARQFSPQAYQARLTGLYERLA